MMIMPANMILQRVGKKDNKINQDNYIAFN